MNPISAKNSLSEINRNQISQLEMVSPWKSIRTYLQVYGAIIIAMYLGTEIFHPLFAILIMIFIAGRQHSLYILNHDASHSSLFKSLQTNKIVATVLSNLAMFHHPEAWSYIQWRRVHLLHHRHLFTKDDPNYVGREQAGDTQRTYTSAQLLWACLLAAPQNLQLFFWGKQDYIDPKSNKYLGIKYHHLATLILPFRDDAEMETERRIKLLFFSVTLLGIIYFNLWQPFLFFWILPMYLFYPMILKFHDLTEHYWEIDSQDLNANTRSVSRNFFLKIIISFLPRGYHREHHMFPKVCVTNLKVLHNAL